MPERRGKVNFQPLRQLLADLGVKPDPLRMLMEAAGLDPTRVYFSQSEEAVHREVLAEVDRHRGEPARTFLEKLRERYPENPELGAELTKLRQELDGVEGANPALHTSPGMPRDGEYFAGYYLIEQLDKGGDSYVFKAEPPTVTLGYDGKPRHYHVPRCVALKVRKQAKKERELNAEPEVHAQLRHPNIVALNRVGEAESAGVVRPWMELEYVNGGSLHAALSDHVRAARWSGDLIAALQLVADIAGAVHYLHELGWVHLDIKPANVLMHGHVPKLCDFGLAFRRDAGSMPPGGTPWFKAPEQYGSVAEEGPRPDLIRIDVFGLGVLLWCVVGGAWPPPGSTPEGDRCLRHDDLQASERFKALPEGLSALLLDLTGDSPGARPASAAVVRLRCLEVMEELRHAQCRDEVQGLEHQLEEMRRAADDLEVREGALEEGEEGLKQRDQALQAQSQRLAEQEARLLREHEEAQARSERERAELTAELAELGQARAGAERQRNLLAALLALSLGGVGWLMAQADPAPGGGPAGGEQATQCPTASPPPECPTAAPPPDCPPARECPTAPPCPEGPDTSGSSGSSDKTGTGGTRTYAVKLYCDNGPSPSFLIDGRKTVGPGESVNLTAGTHIVEVTKDSTKPHELIRTSITVTPERRGYSLPVCQ